MGPSSNLFIFRAETVPYCNRMFLYIPSFVKSTLAEILPHSRAESKETYRNVSYHATYNMTEDKHTSKTNTYIPN